MRKCLGVLRQLVLATAEILGDCPWVHIHRKDTINIFCEQIIFSSIGRLSNFFTDGLILFIQSV